MTLIDKKNGAIRKLRRSHFEGLCVELAYSKHYTAIQARISNVQVCTVYTCPIQPSNDPVTSTETV